MKLLVALLVLASTSVFAKTVDGHIHFQKASTYVSAYYNKTLCLDGDTFKAEVSTCTKKERDGEGETVCVRYGKKTISQPMQSTRTICARKSEDECLAYKTVPFFQSANVDVNVYSNQDVLVDSFVVTVPNCESGK